MVSLYEGLLVKIPTRALKAYPLASILLYVIVFLTAVGRGSIVPRPDPHNSKLLTSSSLVVRKSDTSLIYNTKNDLTTSNPSASSGDITEASARVNHSTSTGFEAAKRGSSLPDTNRTGDGKETVKSVHLFMPPAHAQDTDSCKCLMIKNNNINR